MQTGYFKSAWNDIRGSQGWVGKMFLLSLLFFIPIFGQIVVYGYLFGWARDVAWGLQSPLPRKIFGNEDGKLYSRGFFILVLGAVLSIVPMLLMLITFSLTGALGVGIASDGKAGFAIIMGLLAVVVGIITAAAFFAVIFINWVGAMRISIYGSLSAGFQFKKIVAMIRKDSGGLLRIFGMYLLLAIGVSIITSILSSIVGFVVAAATLGAVGGSLASSYGDSTPSIGLILAAGGFSIVLTVIVSYLSLVLGVFIQTMIARALGYWLRQFDVPSWRGQDDPMPFELLQATQPVTQPVYEAAPPMYQGAPPAQQAAPPVHQGVPPAQEATSGYQQQQYAVPAQQVVPDTQQAISEFSQGVPPAHHPSPEGQQGMPPVQQADPDVQQGMPSVQQTSPDVQQEVSPVQQTDGSEVQQDTTGDQQNIPPAQESTPPTQQ